MNKAEIFKAMSFGINEQILSLLAALGGLINKKRLHLVGLLIIFSLASALPDVYTYTTDPKFKHNKTKALFEGLVILLSESVCVMVVGAPLLLIKNKKVSSIFAMALGLLLIIFNQKILQNSNTEDTIQTCFVAALLIFISYAISTVVTKKFNIKD